MPATDAALDETQVLAGLYSFFRFQDGERIPEEDLHLSDPSLFQAHMPPAPRAWSFLLLHTHSLRSCEWIDLAIFALKALRLNAL